eukprot:3231892-Rhodomonas_salina.5
MAPLGVIAPRQYQRGCFIPRRVSTSASVWLCVGPYQPRVDHRRRGRLPGSTIPYFSTGQRIATS